MRTSSLTLLPWPNTIGKRQKSLNFSLKSGYQQSGSITQGPPTPRSPTDTSPRPVRSWAAQQEVSSGRASETASAAPHRSPWLAVPPEPSPHLVVEKLSSTKPVSGAKKFGDRCYNGCNVGITHRALKSIDARASNSAILI